MDTRKVTFCPSLHLSSLLQFARVRLQHNIHHRIFFCQGIDHPEPFYIRETFKSCPAENKVFLITPQAALDPRGIKMSPLLDHFCQVSGDHPQHSATTWTFCELGDLETFNRHMKTSLLQVAMGSPLPSPEPWMTEIALKNEPLQKARYKRKEKKKSHGANSSPLLHWSWWSIFALRKKKSLFTSPELYCSLTTCTVAL